MTDGGSPIGTGFGARHLLMRNALLATCLLEALLTAAAATASPPPISLLPKVGAQQFDIAYRLDQGAGQLEAVVLWYTIDEGRTWRRFGADTNRVSPITFLAPSEGLYGFFFVASNSVGASSADPDSATQPHQWAYVDYTPPVVQLHTVRQTQRGGKNPVAQIRWSAYDNALTNRPIELSHAPFAEGPWRTIESHLPNSGLYDWHVPQDVSGETLVRITVRDRGGHVAEATSQPLDIQRPNRASADASVKPATNGETPRPEIAPTQNGGTQTGRRRAEQLFREAKIHSSRSEYMLASSRLRDVLAIEPTSSVALVELGRVLYVQQDLSGATESYQYALRYDPGSRAAMEGLARVLIAERRFPEAVAQLGNIVRTDPNDVETWLHLGDVAIYQGDELLAAQHYERAATRDPSDGRTIRQARTRLEHLSRIAAEFRQDRVR